MHDERSNSIGALLAHMAAVERGYQIVTFNKLQVYVDELRRTRDGELAALAMRDDAWLEVPLRIASALNAHWAWCHVAEDEINHRGQVRWRRARLSQQLAVKH